MEYYVRFSERNFGKCDNKEKAIELAHNVSKVFLERVVEVCTKNNTTNVYTRVKNVPAFVNGEEI